MSNKQVDDTDPVGVDQVAQEDTENADLAFLELDQSGTVDLDALFDALNIASGEGDSSMDFSVSGDESGGTLTVSASELNLGSVAPEDLPDAADLLLKSQIISDES